MIWILPLAFFGIAFLYAMAGFGGGSAYIAILAISGLPVAAIPVLALTCNLIVSGQGSIQLARSGLLKRRLVVPLLIGSVPAAFLGGAWRIDDATYLVVLASVLLLAGLALLFKRKAGPGRQASPLVLGTIGAVLGGLAGISGIGGGIFLAPVLHLLRLESSKAIAGCAAIFIAVNSTAGLIGQLSKGPARLDAIPGFLYLACPVLVLAGGWIGTRRLTQSLSPSRVRSITGIVVILAAVRLWLNIILGI